MIRLLTALFLSIQCVCAVEINVPDKWTRKEIPSEMPPSIRTMIQVVSPSEDAEVSLSVMDVVMSLDEAAESYVRGMAKKGFQHKATAKVMHNGYDGRHITGSLLLPGVEDLIPVEAYIVLTPDTMVTAGVFGAEASTLAKQVLSWIDFQDVVAPSTEPTTTGRSFWEYVGIAIVLGAVCYAIFNSASSQRKKRGQQAAP